MNISQYLDKIDYNWQKPETYMVFVPGLSLLIQKIQMAKVMPLKPNRERTSQDVADNEKAKKFLDICRWHLRGALTQIAVCTIAARVFALPIFTLIALVSSLEMGSTLGKAYEAGSILIYTYKDPSPADANYRSAINLF